MSYISREHFHKTRIEAHNAGYLARFGIPPEQAPFAHLNSDWFVQKIESPWRKDIAPGVTLSAHELKLSGEDFTNVYDLCLAPGSPASLELFSFSQPKKPTHIFRDAPDLIALANASFFYIIDDTDEVARKGPKDGTLNWCVRNGQLLGLPSADRPALFEVGGRLEGRMVRARGEISINDEVVTWEGGQRIMHAPKEEWANLYDPHQATVFNSACTAITKEQDNPHGLRMLDKETYFTPEHENVCALAVSLDKDGMLRVQDIKKGGGMGLFDGHFILQIPEELFDRLHITKGSVVSPLSVDGIDLSSVNSALTVGPSVKDYKSPAPARAIDMDKSFGQPPPFGETKRYARTIVLKDAEGVHIRIYDAVPVSSHFNGISPKEIAELIPDETEWAFFCDGGQSTIMGIREGESAPEFFGNNHYGTQKHAAKEALQRGEPIPPGSTLFGRRRPLPSAIGIRVPAKTEN